MDKDGLPIVGTGIDFTKVGAIHQKRTMAFLNHFITQTAHFLNKFSCVCEEKLENISIKMQRLETTMNILEAKLSSIPSLDNISVVCKSTTSSTIPCTIADDVSTGIEVTSGPAPSSVPPSSAQFETFDELEKQEAPKMTVANDPRYAKYFKMLNVGVPPGALKQKMIVDGLDPDLLETPDAPVMSGGWLATDQQELEDSNSDADFTDDDNNTGDDVSCSSSGFSD